MYGPVRTVVWQGSAGDRRPYADQSVLSVAIRANGVRTGYFGFGRAGLTGFGHGGRYRREHAQPGANGAASLPASVGDKAASAAYAKMAANRYTWATFLRDRTLHLLTLGSLAKHRVQWGALGDQRIRARNSNPRPFG